MRPANEGRIRVFLPFICYEEDIPREDIPEAVFTERTRGGIS